VSGAIRSLSLSKRADNDAVTLQQAKCNASSGSVTCFVFLPVAAVAAGLVDGMIHEARKPQAIALGGPGIKEVNAALASLFNFVHNYKPF
jgi:hypothetical protein